MVGIFTDSLCVGTLTTVDGDYSTGINIFMVIMPKHSPLGWSIGQSPSSQLYSGMLHSISHAPLSLQSLLQAWGHGHE